MSVESRRNAALKGKVATLKADLDTMVRERDMLLDAAERDDRRIRELEEYNDRMEAALERIHNWSRAYPLSVFPEPDFKRAAKVLEAAGMTIDAISASNMRHVVEGVGEIARKALEGE